MGRQGEISLGTRAQAGSRQRRSGRYSSTESGTEGGAKGEVGKPFVLSEGLHPVPHKLAARIIRGEYIDMAELLRDNLEA